VILDKPLGLKPVKQSAYDSVLNSVGVSVYGLVPYSVYGSVWNSGPYSVYGSANSVRDSVAVAVENYDFICSTISNFYASLLEQSEPIGREFEEVLYGNLWDLYER
jgi:hypothetical protein